MNATPVAFAFSALCNPPAQQSGYSASNYFVTNSGLYDVTICDARYGSRMVQGQAQPTIELRCLATHKLHPEHSGRMMLKIPVPNPNEPHSYDYLYQCLCVATGIIEQQKGPDGQIWVVPNFGEQQIEHRFAGLITQLTALTDKRLIVNVSGREYQGRRFLSPMAIFDEAGYSGREIGGGAKQQGAQPYDINSCNVAYEGLPLEAVQRQSAGSNGGGFSAEPQPQLQAAPQNAFAAPQQPQAPQPPANPYAQMQQAGQQQPQQAQPQAAKPQPAFNVPSTQDDKIPF